MRSTADEDDLYHAIEYISQDELVEVTPRNVRLSKRILNTEDRKKATKERNLALAAATAAKGTNGANGK